MDKENSDFIVSVLKKLAKVNYIKPGDLPNIDLYMDQVTTFMDEHLSDSKRHENDKILTKTMINNYTKNDLLPPPVKKKYSKEHLYMLTFIYYFKNILSISDIQKLLNPLCDNCFDEKAKPNLDDVYKEVYDMCRSQVPSISKDIITKSRLAGNSFKKVTDKDEKDFLEFFSLVSLLSFDVYLKHTMIENLIDDYTEKHKGSDENSKK